MRCSEPDTRPHKVSRTLKVLSHKLHRAAQGSIPPEVRRDTTDVQGRVLGFLHCSQGPVFQKDVEAEFSITRATASKMLTRMEQNGLITRSAVAGDARLKQLTLTERGQEHILRVVEGMTRFEQRLTDGLTDEELDTLLALLRRLENNLDRGPLAAENATEKE